MDKKKAKPTLDPSKYYIIAVSNWDVTECSSKKEAERILEEELSVTDEELETSYTIIKGTKCTAKKGKVTIIET